MRQPTSIYHSLSCTRAIILPRPSTRLFSFASFLSAKQLPPRLKIDDADLTVSYLKGTGPGGQKINKTNSAVQLIHKPTGIVVKSQATRSRSQNEKIARQILADKVEELQKGDQSRNAIRIERARKKKASKVKKSRRKYRDLENGGQEVEDECGLDGEVGEVIQNLGDRLDGKDSGADGAPAGQKQG